MNLPRRPMARMRRPASIALISSALPRKIRAQVNSAETIRRPTTRAIDRTTVSTSGSSGTFRHFEQDVVAFDCDRVGGNLLAGIEVVGASLAVPLPGMPGANDMIAVQGALPQWSATVQTRSTERGDASADVAK